MTGLKVGWHRLRGTFRDLSKRPAWRWGAVGVVVALVAMGLWLMLRALPEAIDPTWERIQDTGILRVCTDPSWPPFEFIDQGSGQIEGFDAELARVLAARLAPDVRARIVTVGFDSLYDALLADRCDAVLSALPYEPMRVEDVAYSIAYFNAGLVLVTRQETSDVKTLEDLEDVVVGTEWGFVPEGDSHQRLFLQNLGLRRYDTAPDTLRALQAGEVEVALVDRITALTYLRDCRGLHIVGEPITDVNYVIPVRLDSFRLLEEVNRVLLEMRDDGTLEGLLETWF
jgi:polar amino acid transport system substrate-binding protein